MVSILSAVSPIILIIIPLSINPDFYVTFQAQEINLTAANVTIDPEIR